MPTEKQKMLAGELYDPLDPELVADRLRARKMAFRLTQIEPGDDEALRALLREYLPNAAPDVWLEPPLRVDYGWNIHTGPKCFFNFDCVLLDVMPIRIGRNAMFAPGVHVYTATHPLDAVERNSGVELARPVTIGDDCWIGGRAVICPGVTIGHRCVIGAGAVVTRDVPDDTVVAGSPARMIRRLK